LLCNASAVILMGSVSGNRSGHLKIVFLVNVPSR
jgi:hypothetical protein